MATSNENADRRVVPRWRTFREALTCNELAAATVLKSPSIDGTSFLREKEILWQTQKELTFAVDLVSASTVLGDSIVAKSAAEFILENESKVSSSAKLLARGLLGIEPKVQSSSYPQTSIGIIHDIKKLKTRRLSQMRNAFVWSDLARLYVLLGQIEPARQAMRVALSLTPTDRFVVRCATRFLLHIKDVEQALHLLRKNPRTPTDPWLASAEIAVSSIVDKSPKFTRQANDLLKSADIPAFHTSELASALGSLEMFEGNNRKANKLFTTSLKDPTDNSLAQAIWASKKTGLDTIDIAMLDRPNISEAKTFNAFNQAEWENVIICADAWASSEGFSARPRLLASSVAASLVGDLSLAEEIARNGLVTNPGHPGLINNLAFAMIHAGKVEEAIKLLDTIDHRVIGPGDTTAVCLVATAGLAYYRSGNPIEGKRYYDSAIEAATRLNNLVLKTTARLYLARERVLQNESGAFKEFQKAHDDAKKFKNTSLPDVAERLAKQVMDSEIHNKSGAAKMIQPALTETPHLPLL